MAKIQRVEFSKQHTGRHYQWAETRKKARDIAAQIKANPDPNNPPDGDEVLIEAVEIDTTRAGLCNWLNAHFYTDNG